MINKIKKEILNLRGKKVTVLVDIGRNKMEEHIGVIDELYSSVWTMRTDKGIKCYSYKDVLIQTVKIKPF